MIHARAIEMASGKLNNLYKGQINFSYSVFSKKK